MKRHFLIGIFILAVMVSAGTLTYAATRQHIINESIPVTMNVTAPTPLPPIIEKVYEDPQLSHVLTALNFTYPEGEQATKTIYVSSNITPSSIVAIGNHLPGDSMIAGVVDQVTANYTSIVVTAFGATQGLHTGITLDITGEGN